MSAFLALSSIIFTYELRVKNLWCTIDWWNSIIVIVSVSDTYRHRLAQLGSPRCQSNTGGLGAASHQLTAMWFAISVRLPSRGWCSFGARDHDFMPVNKLTIDKLKEAIYHTKMKSGDILSQMV